jgi:hypothetical protein
MRKHDRSISFYHFTLEKAMTEVIRPKKQKQRHKLNGKSERISCFARVFDFPGNKEACQHRASAQKVVY